MRVLKEGRKMAEIKDLEQRVRERVEKDGQYILTLNMAKFLEDGKKKRGNAAKIRRFLERLGDEYTYERFDNWWLVRKA